MLIQAAQLLLSLSILIILHEFGHYLAARAFGIRVEKFYLFFNPWFSVFKKKVGETEWGIGWLPLGGYVKISGMVDESFDTEQMEKPPQPYEFRSKPAWQRLIVMAGGVIVNLILGIIIYIFTLFSYGDDYLPVQNAQYGFVCDSVLIEQGFQNGDQILKIGEAPLDNYVDLTNAVLIEGHRDVTVLRNGQEVSFQLDDDVEEQILASGSRALFFPRVLFYVDSIVEGGNSVNSGIQKGDQVLAVNEVETKFYDQFTTEVPKLKNQEVAIRVSRDGTEQVFKVQVDSLGKVGLGNRAPNELLTFVHKDFTFGEAVSAGATKGFETLFNYVKSLRLLFSKEGAKQIGGFGTIGKLFAKQWDWERFWSMTAFISIMLAFMNVLPIPALDGGYILFLFYEMISGREVPTKVIERANMVGFVLLIALLLYANGNDLFRG